MSETATEQPSSSVESTPSPAPDPNAPEATQKKPVPAVAQVLRLKVPVIAELASRRVSVGIIRQLNIGSVVEFNKPLRESLTLLVNNQPFATGKAVKVGDKFGLRVIDLCAAITARPASAATSAAPAD